MRMVEIYEMLPLSPLGKNPPWKDVAVAGFPVTIARIWVELRDQPKALRSVSAMVVDVKAGDELLPLRLTGVVWTP